MKYFAETIDPVIRANDNQLFHIIIEAKPAESNKEDDGTIGAFANFWIDAEELLTAEKICMEILKDEHWEPEAFGEFNIVTEDEYLRAKMSKEDRNEVMQMCAEARENGSAHTYYCWDEE